jgi:hypothetical protein
MIDMQMTNPDLLPRQSQRRAFERESARGGALPVADPAAPGAQFPPLDPGCVSDAIPAFFIGRNKEGFWVARDARGLMGGLFLSESGALSFARRNSQPIRCATIYPSETIELDLKNMGNPLVARLAPLKRLAQRVRQRLGTLVGV